MTGETLYTLTVLFSVITGTAAGVLSLLAWEILQRSPFGRAVFVLSIVLTIFVLYHVLLLFSPGVSMVASVFKSAIFTGVVVFIWIMVWNQHQLQTRPRTESDV